MGSGDSTIEIKGGGAEAWRVFRQGHPDATAAALVNGALDAYVYGEWVPVAGAARRRFGELGGSAVPEWSAWDSTIGAFETLFLDEGTLQRFRQALVRNPGLHAVGFSDFIAGAVAALDAGDWAMP